MLPECTKLHFGRILYGHNLINTLLYNYKAPCIILKCKKWIFDAKFMERILNLTGQRIVKMQPDKKLSKCSIVKRVFVIIVDLIIYVGTQSRKTKAFAYLLKGLVCSTVQWIRFHLYQGFIKQILDVIASFQAAETKTFTFHGKVILVLCKVSWADSCVIVVITQG